MRQFFARLLQSFRRTDTARRVVWDDDGFRVDLDTATIAQCAWGDVIEVYAFKLDLFGYDEICLGFRRGGEDGDPWVGEDDVGYREFEAQLEPRFPGIRNDWFHEVAFPAFVENRTTLWGEPPPGSEL